MFDENVSLISAKQIMSPDFVPEAKLSLAYLARQLEKNAWAKCVVTNKSLTLNECERLGEIETLLRLDLSHCQLPTGGLTLIIGGNKRLHYLILEETRVSVKELESVCNHPSIYKVLTSKPQLSRIRQRLDFDCREKFVSLNTILI
ncbi:hypothetical protein GCM10023156_44860 [Novipirellula rosea]|uniref:Uncharacterized protein n=1 Tax=Novipirellula rosea TaxID=1031540 RepID=A0ABP8N8G7_9BACT